MPWHPSCFLPQLTGITSCCDTLASARPARPVWLPPCQLTRPCSPQPARVCHLASTRPARLLQRWRAHARRCSAAQARSRACHPPTCPCPQCPGPPCPPPPSLLQRLVKVHVEALFRIMERSGPYAAAPAELCHAAATCLRWATLGALPACGTSLLTCQALLSGGGCLPLDTHRASPAFRFPAVLVGRFVRFVLCILASPPPLPASPAGAWRRRRPRCCCWAASSCWSWRGMKPARRPRATQCWRRASSPTQPVRAAAAQLQAAPPSLPSLPAGVYAACVTPSDGNTCRFESGCCSVR